MKKSFYLCVKIWVMERKKLVEVVDIFSGLFKKQAEESANAAYIQLANLHQFSESSDGEGKVAPSVALTDKEMGSKHLLRSGDVLLVVKGSSRAVVYVPCEGVPAVASTSFAVLRMKAEYAERINPKYLCWWLNSSYALDYYAGAVRGSSVSVLPLKLLEELEINIPTMEFQEHFVKAYEVSKSRYELALEKAQTMWWLDQSVLENMVDILK